MSSGPRWASRFDPSAPLLGRDFELAVLERMMDDLVEGRGAIVSILGEPGIGKSRLVAEVCRRYRDRVRFVEGRAVSYAQSFPYYSIRDLLREWLGVSAETPEARSRLELKAELARLFGEDAEEAYPFIGSLLGIKLEPDALAALREPSRESVQRQTFEYCSASSAAACRASSPSASSSTTSTGPTTRRSSCSRSSWRRPRRPRSRSSSSTEASESTDRGVSASGPVSVTRIGTGSSSSDRCPTTPAGRSP